MKIIRLIFVIVLTICCSCKNHQHESPKPKLVVGIVVDQMRYDYLSRFYHRYGEGGFKRLLNNGFSLENAHFNYIPTYTAVGHASVYTGTTPNMHGIIGNWWYDKYAKRSIYCVTDTTYATVGSNTFNGQRSPYRLQTTTIADQLKLGQNMNGKTIGVAIKDRSSILPIGHTGTAAYWFDSTRESKIISSNFYMDSLPQWVQDFNDKDLAGKYASMIWTPLYDIDSYTSSLPDNNPHEAKFNGEETPTFPHDLPLLKSWNGGKSIIKATPFGNSMTLDLAKAAITGENLGRSEYTDFLAISFSSTDYVGHQYGPDAVETEDTYLRLDRDLASLLTFLDTEIGSDNYTLFLTADHAAAQVPSYLQSLNIPAGYFDSEAFRAYMKNASVSEFGSDKIIEKISNHQIFLNAQELKRLRLSRSNVSQTFADVAIKFPTIYKAVTARTLQTTYFGDGILKILQNGYNQKFSGDVLLIPNPSYITGHENGGTTHGSGYSYDTHIPIIFYGNGIKKGNSKLRYSVTDIAPTLANLLHIEFPNGTTGRIINEVLKE